MTTHSFNSVSLSLFSLLANKHTVSIYVALPLWILESGEFASLPLFSVLGQLA
jgi:hypothetical protein